MVVFCQPKLLWIFSNSSCPAGKHQPAMSIRVSSGMLSYLSSQHSVIVRLASDQSFLQYISTLNKMSIIMQL